jgi:succinate-acetate transporter protein
MPQTKSVPICNPVVIGLRCFSLITIILQLFLLNLGGLFPAIACIFVYGCLALFIAHFNEQKSGSNFVSTAFVACHVFLLSLSIIQSDLSYFAYPAMTNFAEYQLIFCALNGWHMIAHIIFPGGASFDELPAGRFWIEPGPAVL